MVRLSTDQYQLLAKSKSYEEFLVNKELLGFGKRKKFGQKVSYIILMWMAYFDKCDLACKLVKEAKHITIGDYLKDQMYSCLNASWAGKVQPFKKNAMAIYKELCIWFAPH